MGFKKLFSKAVTSIPTSSREVGERLVYIMSGQALVDTAEATVEEVEEFLDGVAKALEGDDKDG